MQWCLQALAAEGRSAVGGGGPHPGPSAQGQVQQPVAAGSSGRAASAAAPGTPAGAFAWLIRCFVALLAWLGLAAGQAGASKRSRKRRAKAPTTAAGGEAAEDVGEGPDKVGESGAVAAAARQKPVVAAPAAPATPAAPPAAKVAAAGGAATKPSPVRAAPVASPQPASTTAADQVPAAPAPPARAAAPSPAAKPPTVPASPAAGGPTAAAAGAGAAGPSIKCDADWQRGMFVLREVKAHADVVSSVVLAGDVAVSCGYDASIKVRAGFKPRMHAGGARPHTHPRAACTSGPPLGGGNLGQQPRSHCCALLRAGRAAAVCHQPPAAVNRRHARSCAMQVWSWARGPVPSLECARTLVGHQGHVEALAADASTRRLASTGRDSTLKVPTSGGTTRQSMQMPMSISYVCMSASA